MKIAALVGLPLSGRTTVAAVAREFGIQVVNSLEETSGENVVVDEVDLELIRELKQLGEIYTIALLTPTKRRYEFSDKSISIKQFLRRDRKLLEAGMDKIIALADYNLVNEGNLEDLRFEAKRIFSKIFGIEQVFLWAWKMEKAKIINLISKLFPDSRIYEGKDKILASTSSINRLKGIVREIKAPLLQYFDIKPQMTHVIEENVLKFGLDKNQAFEKKIGLATSFKKNLILEFPVPDVLMIELVTKDPKKFVEGVEV